MTDTQLAELRSWVANARNNDADLTYEVLDRMESVLAEVAELRELVRVFAEMHPFDDIEGYCRFCSAGPFLARKPRPHDADCAWLRAQKWGPQDK
jgi:hypothetical protein